MTSQLGVICACHVCPKSPSGIFQLLPFRRAMTLPPFAFTNVKEAPPFQFILVRTPLAQFFVLHVHVPAISSPGQTSASAANIGAAKQTVNAQALASCP